MKRLSAILAAAVLAGCTTTAAMQSYRPANYAGPAWNITGTLDQVSSLLTVTINGAPAAQGKLSMWDGSGEITGRYGEKTVTASCLQTGMVTTYFSNLKTVCTVFVDNERAATLQF